jgi:catechol 2,3-dioxygenase-like lactoylglutathione lyase family enzyme
MKELQGIHHVTAICSNAQTNIDFYAGTLGLRLVKLTVNFDDPTAYHLYYGDSKGTPGTVVTFFPYAGHLGRAGDGSFTKISLAAPAGSLEFWRDRVGAGEIEEGKVMFKDPDGIELEIVAADGPAGAAPHTTSEVSLEHAIRGVDRVRLSSKRTDTMIFLSNYLEFKEAGAHEDGETLGVAECGSGALIDVTTSKEKATGGPGTIHHVAWRIEDDDNQLAWQEYLGKRGVGVSPVRDRDYFHSIYFREPGGALFEIATDGPGFDVDEPMETMGTKLMLPAQHEHLREKLLEVLPKIVLPGANESEVAP